MSLVPEFELGLWNAWIIAVLGFIITIIPFYIDQEVVNKRTGADLKWSNLSKTDKIVMIITHIILMPFTIIYSFFLPLKLGTIWFYVGVPISLLGIIMGFMAAFSFATAPTDKPITNGAYSISRNPMYFSGFLEYLGIGICCLSWVFILCAVVEIISFHMGVVQSEEPFLIEKYGAAYKDYMNKTPRWIGIPKSEKE